MPFEGAGVFPFEPEAGLWDCSLLLSWLEDMAVAELVDADGSPNPELLFCRVPGCFAGHQGELSLYVEKWGAWHLIGQMQICLLVPESTCCCCQSILSTLSLGEENNGKKKSKQL